MYFYTLHKHKLKKHTHTKIYTNTLNMHKSNMYIYKHKQTHSKSPNVLVYLGLVFFTDILCHKKGTSLIPWSSLLLVPFHTSLPNKFQFTGTKRYIPVKAQTKQWVTHTTYKMAVSVLNVTAKLCFYNVFQIIFNNTHVPT